MPALDSAPNNLPKITATGLTDAAKASLLGTAVGDALGLPAEGLSRSRIARLWQGKWHHRLIVGRGMFSDDTEHAMMTAAALIEHRDDVEAFQRALARSLRLWLAALPAGTGMATAKAIIRLWLGVSPKRSGIRSAGNGAAMRSAIIGVMYANDEGKRRVFTLVSCHITHVDPRAEEAALIVAEAASLAVRGVDSEEAMTALLPLMVSHEMQTRWGHLQQRLSQSASVQDYTNAIGCGEAVSGFAPNTIAVVLYAWLRHRGDFRTALEEVLNCGGDVDTMGAILGGIMGIETPEEKIPREWREGICDWPRSMTHLQKLGTAFAGTSAPCYFWPAIAVRNLLFLLVVIGHGFRRLLPPY